MDKLKVKRFRNLRDHDIQYSRIRRGSVITFGTGNECWYGSIQIVELTFDDGEDQAALVGVANTVRGSFLYSPPHYDGPRTQAAVTGGTVSALRNGNQMKITGLPDGYKLVRGDYFSYVDGNGFERLHQLLSAGTAGTDGETGWFDVFPGYYAGAVGLAVELARPVCRAKVTSADYGEGDFQTDTFSETSFEWEQVFA